MNFHGGQLRQNGMMDFSVNIPSIPYEEAFRNLLIASIERLNEYPEIDGASARDSVATFLGIDANQVVLGNGATDLIYLISRANRFKRVAILQPTFTEYERALRQEGTEVQYIELQECNNTFEIKPDDMAAAVNNSQSEALFICNPNNPTGQIILPGSLEIFLKQVVNPEFLLIIDESFIEFKDHSDHHQLMKKLIGKYNIIIIRSMTKTYRVPGLRIGYLFGTEKIVKKIAEARDPWALNHMAIMSIPYFLEQTKFVEELHHWCEIESKFLLEALNKTKHIKYFKNDANFILIKINVDKANGFYEKMIDLGVHLRKCTDFRGLNEQYFRLAVMDRDKNIKLIEKIREALND